MRSRRKLCYVKHQRSQVEDRLSGKIEALSDSRNWNRMVPMVRVWENTRWTWFCGKNGCCRSWMVKVRGGAASDSKYHRDWPGSGGGKEAQKGRLWAQMPNALHNWWVLGEGGHREDVDEPPTASWWHDLPQKWSQVTVGNVSRGSLHHLASQALRGALEDYITRAGALG